MSETRSVRAVGDALGGTWTKGVGVGVLAFVVVQLLSGFLYPDGIPANVAGFPLPFLSTVSSPGTGTELVFSPVALAANAAVWIALGVVAVAAWHWRR